MASPVLHWSSQLSVLPSSEISSSLVGDKILLPQSALEQLLAAVSSTQSESQPTPALTDTYPPQVDVSWASAARHERPQPQLPHPLMFRLFNPRNNRFSHAAPLEFSAEEGKIGISPLLRDALGIDEDVEMKGVGEGEVVEDEDKRITVVWKDLPRGTYVRLRPLEAGYDEEDWKALLERYLRVNFTTLTVGEILAIGARTLAIGGKEKAEFRFLIDAMKPEEAVCIVDTDLEVDIEPLSEEQARETLKQRLARKSVGSSGGALKIGQPAKGGVLPGEYHFYELSEWDRKEPLVIELDEVDDGDEVDIFATTSKHHHKPQQDEHVWGDSGSKYPKTIQINPTNIELVDVERIFIGVHGYAPLDIEDGSEQQAEEDGSPRPYSLRITQTEIQDTEAPIITSPPSPDYKQCRNCTQWVPTRTFILHENFCLRNNLVCPQCHQVSKRGAPNTHWHCQQCTAHGNNTPYSLRKHVSIYHTPRPCPACASSSSPYTAVNLPDLAIHRTTTCPEKLVLCRFCHLLLPQESSSNHAELLLLGLTHHELTCGGRTTNCHLCNRIVRMRDLDAHVRNHDLKRLSTPPPITCRNVNCARTTKGLRHPNPFGLCGSCFGPLYAPGYDPGDIALGRRLERRLIRQAITGCDRVWCRNEMCKTGRANLGIADDPAQGVGVAGVMPLIKKVVQDLKDGGGELGLCVDEGTQKRRHLAERIAVESVLEKDGGWDVSWVVAAVEEVSGAGEEEGAIRAWLDRNAVRRGER
ncbi:ubiquitin fusion degradation protein UFD1-domain-containing protein [Tuber indicum]|nr:ubiquitin fusion degradation protein UFD1-domain-containing protein [Tuber indicum]